MTASAPAPRAALIRHEDGTVRPAAPHLSSLAVDSSSVVKAAKKARKRAKSKPADETVELVVVLSKRDRKRLRKRAENYGWTAEEAAAHILRAWAESR